MKISTTFFLSKKLDRELLLLWLETNKLGEKAIGEDFDPELIDDEIRGRLRKIQVQVIEDLISVYAELRDWDGKHKAVTVGCLENEDVFIFPCAERKAIQQVQRIKQNVLREIRKHKKEAV